MILDIGTNSKNKIDLNIQLPTIECIKYLFRFILNTGNIQYLINHIDLVNWFYVQFINTRILKKIEEIGFIFHQPFHLQCS